MTGNDVCKEAWDAFAKWCDEHDPEDELSVEEKVNRYSEWCEHDGSNLP